MRSWRDRSCMRALAACLLFAACTASGPADDAGDDGGDDGGEDPCATSYLTYDNFGAPFVTSWCRSCHSSQLPPSERQTAPTEVNFDDLDDVRQWSPRIAFRAGTQKTMPPAGGPSDAERSLLVEWLACGAP